MEVQLSSAYKDNDTEKQYTLEELKMLKCYILHPNHDKYQFISRIYSLGKAHMIASSLKRSNALIIIWILLIIGFFFMHVNCKDPYNEKTCTYGKEEKIEH